MESKKWMLEERPARLSECLPNGSVRCHLSPRNCVIPEGGSGFCKVRANRNGKLVTLNYGKGVHNTEETIETEAVYHYAPGERILSLGNIGCMLNCGYCHNWKTSQARFVTDRDVHYYTPQQVVDSALRHGIRVLSWTYNDPVVWHEFVLDTAKLAKEAGLKNLFKSAFFISPEAVEELLPVIDIFSISIKSVDPEYYRKVTTGWMEPVLEATKQVYKAGKHVEVSTLMVTDISDDESTAKKVSEWVLTELDSSVPLHFVRFHPDYKMNNSIRTPIPRLLRAREIAQSLGVKHVYLGNVNGVDATNTRCSECGSLLVTRYGLNAINLGLNLKGECKECGCNMHFKLFDKPTNFNFVNVLPEYLNTMETKKFKWHGDVVSLHVQVVNTDTKPNEIYFRREFGTQEFSPWRKTTLQPGESYRFIVAKSREDEIGPEVLIPNNVNSNLHEVFDRAHYPTQAIEEVGVSAGDITPIAKYPGEQNMYNVIKKQLGKVDAAND